MIKFFGYSILVFVGLIALAITFGDPGDPPKPMTPEERAEAEKWQGYVVSMRQLRESMNDPSRFSLTQALEMDSGAVCVEYRGSNAFNAIVPGRSVIFLGLISSSESDWNSLCAGQTGKDITHIRRAM